MPIPHYSSAVDIPVVLGMAWNLGLQPIGTGIVAGVEVDDVNVVAMMPRQKCEILNQVNHLHRRLLERD